MTRQDRAGSGAAQAKLVLFLEYIPHAALRWMVKHDARLPWLYEEMRESISFLQRNHVIHFDAHTTNIVTDGSMACLTDFGLGLDLDFELTRAEKDFFRDHRLYDSGQLMHSFAVYPAMKFRALSQKTRAGILTRFGIPHEFRIGSTFIERIEELAAGGVTQNRVRLMPR